MAVPISIQLLGANVRLGAGTVKEVGQTFQAAGAKKVLIVTDSGVAKAGLLQPVKKSLEEAKLSFEVFDRVEPNPSDRTVMEGVQLFKKTGCNAILGVGGGSCPGGLIAPLLLFCTFNARFPFPACIALLIPLISSKIS